MTSEYQTYIEEYKKDIEDDTIGLWEIVSCIQCNFSPVSDGELKEKVLNFIREMLAQGFIAGESEYSATGYKPWDNQSPDYIIGRIATEWDALGRTPNIGDIVYFDLR